MQNIIYGIVGLLFGVVLLFFNRRFMAVYVEFQNKLWGYHFSDEQIKDGRFVCVIVGAGFLLVGISALLNIIHFK
jgi:hypothetical protein